MHDSPLPDVIFSQLLVGGDDPVQVSGHVIEDNVQISGFGLWNAMRQQQVPHADDVGVRKVAQDADLAVGPLHHHRRAEGLRDLLDGHSLPGRHPGGCADDPESAGA